MDFYFRARRQSRIFQEALDSIRKENGFPGGVAAFSYKGQSQAFATGFTDPEGKRPMRKNARMLSASIGKMHVGALAYSLNELGIVDLDKPISEWLGEREWFSRLPNRESITLWCLLNHTAGLQDHVSLPAFLEEALPKMQDPDFYYQPEMLVAFILDKEPLFPAGEQFSYTDTGFILIGLAIEQATGKPYYTLLKQNLLEPFAFSDTLPADRRDIPRLVPGYLAEDNPLGLARSTMKGGKLIRHPLSEWTGGGLADTALGLVKWSHALFHENAVFNDYQKAVRKYAYTPDKNDTDCYGLGVAVKQSTLGACYCHGGWTPGYRSFVGYFSDHGLSASIMVNTDDNNLISDDGVRNAVTYLATQLIDIQ